jgi:hypothetical protein
MDSIKTTEKTPAQLIDPLLIFWPEVRFQVHLQDV